MAPTTYTPESLQTIRDALERHAKTAVAFTCINTRIILQTGVNLRKFTPVQDTDPGAVSKVRDALHGMGVELENAR